MLQKTLHIGLVFVCFLALSACEKKAEDGGSGGENAEGTAAEGQAGPEDDGPKELVWRSDHDAALAAAAKAQQFAVIDFTAEWCAPCKKLDRETFTDPRVIEALGEFVTIRVDGTESPEAVEKEMERHGVEMFPAVVFVAPDGTTLTEPRVGEFLAPDAFLKVVSQVGK